MMSHKQQWRLVRSLVAASACVALSLMSGAQTSNLDSLATEEDRRVILASSVVDTTDGWVSSWNDICFVESGADEEPFVILPKEYIRRALSTGSRRRVWDVGNVAQDTVLGAVMAGVREGCSRLGLDVFSSWFNDAVPVVDIAQSLLDYAPFRSVDYGLNLWLVTNLTLGMKASVGAFGSLVGGATCVMTGNASGPDAGEFGAGDEIKLAFAGTSELKEIRAGATKVSPPVLFLTFASNVQLGGSLDYGFGRARVDERLFVMDVTDLPVDIAEMEAANMFTEDYGIYARAQEKVLPLSVWPKSSEPPLQFGEPQQGDAMYASLTMDVDEFALAMYGVHCGRKSKKAKQEGDTDTQKKYDDRADALDYAFPTGLEWTHSLHGCSIDILAADFDAQLGLIARRSYKINPGANIRFVFSSPVLVEGVEHAEIEVPLTCLLAGSVQGGAAITIPRSLRGPIEVTPTLLVEHEMTGSIEFRASLKGCSLPSSQHGDIATRGLTMGAMSLSFAGGQVWDDDDLCKEFCLYYKPSVPDFWNSECGRTEWLCLPEFTVPEFTIGPIGPILSVPAWPAIEKSLKTVSETVTLRSEHPLEPFLLVPVDPPVMDAHMTSSCPHVGYAGPGDIVTVSVRIEEPVTLLEAMINARPADAVGSGTDWTISRMLDEEDPDGPVTFRFDSDTESGQPAVLSDTTDGTGVICISMPPTAPTELTPPSTTHLVMPHPVLRWNTAYDSAGFPAVEYEIALAVRTCGGETNSERVVAATESERQSFELADSLPTDSVVEWTVRGVDRIDRRGEPSETGTFAFYPPPTIGAVHLESGNSVNSALAVPGDELSIGFDVDSCVGEMTVTVHTPSGPTLAAPVARSGDEWVAVCKIPRAPETLYGKVGFEIEYRKDLPAGFPGDPMITYATRTTDDSSVCVLGAEPPPAPKLEWPKDGAKVFSGAEEQLAWWSMELPAGCEAAEHYEVWIAETKTGGGEEANTHELDTNAFPLPTFADGSTITWRVRAQDSLKRWGPFSAARSFYCTDRLEVDVNQALPGDLWTGSPGTPDPTCSDPVLFVADFSCHCYVDDFDETDVSVGGTSDPSTVAVELTNLPGIWVISVGGMTRPGTVSASIPAGVVHDSFGTPNEASTSTDNVVMFDNSPPKVSVSKPTVLDAAVGDTLVVQVEYPVEMMPMPLVLRFDPDVQAAGSLVFEAAGWEEGNSSYTASYKIEDAETEAFGVDLVVSDAPSASGESVEGVLAVDLLAIDTASPTASVEGMGEVVSDTPIKFTATFSEPIEGLDASDFDVANGYVVSVEFLQGTSFAVQVAAEDEGDVTLVLPAGAVQDVAGNPNEASNEASVFYRPPVKLENILIATSNPSDGYCTIGDTVTLTFEATRELPRIPEVEIGGCSADVTYEGGNQYTATCVMDASTDEGEIGFEIVFNDGTSTEQTVDETTDLLFDSEPPEFDDCPDDITEDEETGQQGAHVTWDEPTAWDSYSGVLAVVSTHDPGDFFQTGTTTVTYTATDNVGLSSTCSFDVTVEPQTQ